MDLPRFDTLALELADHVALVELNRPDKANAMNAAMWRELEECFRWCDREPAVRAVVLAARGRHCARADRPDRQPWPDDVAHSRPQHAADRIAGRHRRAHRRDPTDPA